MLFFKTFFEVKNTFIHWVVDVLFILIITSAIKFVKQGFEQRFLFHEVKAKNLQMELDLLRSQINPHFLFNTLNNMFSIALESNNKVLADSISNLSNLMRYMIYESSEARVPLSKEIELIKRYIDLQKLRFSDSDDIKINFNFDGPIDSIKISPMLIIPLVENAFKHGINLENKSQIDINLNVNPNELIFKVKNIIHSSNKLAESGIGLNNVQRRLELIYPDTHELTIDNNSNIFFIQLRLKMEH